MLIHGVAEDSSIWEQQVALLQNHFRLILPDLPGSGKSVANGDFSMEALADAVAAILAEELITESVMIGHSMGGYVTLAFAEKYPEKLKAFGLFHSSAFADGEEKVKAREKNVAFIRKHGTLPFLQQSTPTLFSEETKQAFPGIVAQIINKYQDFDPSSLAAYQDAMKLRAERTPVLRQTNKPVLFIIGRHDNAIPFSDSMKQCHLPLLSYIHILEKSGHMGMLEETSKSNDILKNFLDDVYLSKP